jgi:hypothetical protein
MSSSFILPKELNNLITQYTNEKEYRDQIIKSNKRTKNKIIKAELEDVPINDLIKFKSSIQLARNWMIEEKNERISLSTVASIFLAFLDIFTYEELLDYKNEDLWVSVYTNVPFESFGDYLNETLSDITSTANSDFSNDKIMYKKLNKNIVKKLQELNLDINYNLYNKAVDNLVAKNIGIYEDTKYIYYIDLFQDELEKIVDKKLSGKDNEEKIK